MRIFASSTSSASLLLKRLRGEVLAQLDCISGTYVVCFGRNDLHCPSFIFSHFVTFNQVDASVVPWSGICRTSLLRLWLS